MFINFFNFISKCRFSGENLIKKVMYVYVHKFLQKKYYYHHYHFKRPKNVWFILMFINFFKSRIIINNIIISNPIIILIYINVQNVCGSRSIIITIIILNTIKNWICLCSKLLSSLLCFLFFFSWPKPHKWFL